MRISYYILFLFIFYQSTAFAGLDSCTLILSGRVLDIHDDAALELANIYLPEYETGVVSNPDGSFSISGICPGKIQLQVSHLGCETRVFSFDIRSDTSVVLHLSHSIYALHDVVITEHAESYYGTLNSSKVDAARLNALSGSALGDILTEIPGVWALQTGPTISKPVIHGLHSNRILIVNNGVRQEGQQWGSEHGPEIDPFIATEITVVKGAGSVRYGSDALGGVVLVQAAPLTTDTALSGALQLAGFSNTKGGAGSAFIEQKMKGLAGISWRLQGSWKSGGDTKTPHYYLANTAYREKNASLALGYNGRIIHSELYASTFQTDLGILAASHIGNLTDLNIALSADTPQIVRDFSYDISSPYQHIVHRLIKSFTTIHTGEIGHIDITLAYQDNRRQEYDQDRNPDSGPSLDFNIGSTTLDLEWKHRVSTHINGSIGLSGMNQQNVWSGRYFIPNFISNTGGVYWLETWLSGPWRIEGGVRYDYRSLRSFRNDGMQITETERMFSNMSGALGLVYRPRPKWEIALNSGSAWRSPAINELYAAGLHHGAASIEYGQADLLAERAWNNSLSTEYQQGGFYIETGAYVNYIKDFIYLEPELPPALTIAGAFPVFRYQQTDALLSGWDVLLVYTIWKELSLECKGSLLRATDLTSKEWIIGMPSDRLEASLKWHFHDRKEHSWDLHIGSMYVWEQTRVPEASDYSPAPPAYTLANAGIGSTFGLGSSNIKWSLEATNLLNTVYRDYMNRFRYYVDETGRNISLHIKIPFNL